MSTIPRNVLLLDLPFFPNLSPDILAKRFPGFLNLVMLFGQEKEQNWWKHFLTLNDLDWHFNWWFQKLTGRISRIIDKLPKMIEIWNFLTFFDIFDFYWPFMNSKQTFSTLISSASFLYMICLFFIKIEIGPFLFFSGIFDPFWLWEVNYFFVILFL